MRAICYLLTCILGTSFSLHAQENGTFHEDFSHKDSLVAWTLRLDDVTRSGVQQHYSAKTSTLSFVGQPLESPLFAVSSLQYYRLDIRSQSSEKLLWGIVFYDAQGTMLLADVYSSIDPSPSIQHSTFYFQSKANAHRAQIWIPAREEQKVVIDEVSITSTSPEAVLTWTDSIYSSIPPVPVIPHPNRLSLLPNTQRALTSGEKIKVVMLGNSIINDTGNSAWELLVEKYYPGTDLEVITSVRGGTGCQYYQENNRVDTFVVQYQPDLLIIGGISHGNDTNAIHNVIRQVREKIQPPPEILVMSGPVGKQGDPRLNPEFSLTPPFGDFRASLEAMATDAEVAYFDMKTEWGKYISESGKDYDYFLRDPVHANARGRQVLARILASYFISSPEGTSPK